MHHLRQAAHDLILLEAPLQQRYNVLWEAYKEFRYNTSLPYEATAFAYNDPANYRAGLHNVIIDLHVGDDFAVSHDDKDGPSHRGDFDWPQNYDLIIENLQQKLELLKAPDGFPNMRHLTVILSYPSDFEWYPLSQMIPQVSPSADGDLAAVLIEAVVNSVRRLELEECIACVYDDTYSGFQHQGRGYYEWDMTDLDADYIATWAADADRSMDMLV